MYITFSTAVAFSAHSGAVFVLEDKVTPRVADGRSGPAGEEESGEGRQKGCPTVTKVFGGQRSGKHLLWPEGTLQRKEGPVAVVCAV